MYLFLWLKYINAFAVFNKKRINANIIINMVEFDNIKKFIM